MPRNPQGSPQNENLALTAQPTPQPTGLQTLPDDVRADLLRAQSDQITTFQRLPRIRIMPAGAGLFEFMDTNATEREFSGIILNSHPRNILWDRAMSDEPPARGSNAESENNAPACSSPDGKHGVPRVGFQHIMLGGRAALGTERIECATCRYNQWGSLGLIRENMPNAKGKATTNQRSLFILMEDRAAPFELTLPPTSLSNYDAYLASLITQSIPVQAVLTIFRQEVKSGQRGIRWGVAKFENGGLLSGDTFNLAMQARREFARQITPPDGAVATDAAHDPQHGMPEDEDAPF